MNKKVSLAALGAGALLLSGCTTAELEAISAGLAQGLAEASYEASAYNAYSSSIYNGAYYAPSGFSSYSGWPTSYAYGQYVGPFGCSHTGSFYTCDSDGDGLNEMLLKSWLMYLLGWLQRSHFMLGHVVMSLLLLLLLLL